MENIKIKHGHDSLIRVTLWTCVTKRLIIWVEVYKNVSSGHARTAFAQSDQGLHYPLTESLGTTECLNVKSVRLILCVSAVWSESAQFAHVRRPFSLDEAHMEMEICLRFLWYRLLFVTEMPIVASSKNVKCLKIGATYPYRGTSRKHAYIVLTPRKPHFYTVYGVYGVYILIQFSCFCLKT